MSTWDFRRESTQVNEGANSALQGLHGYQPFYRADVVDSKKNIIATKKGWVQRTHGTGGRAGRVQEEVIVAANPGVQGKTYASNTYLGDADVAFLYIDEASLNANGNITAGQDANLAVVFNEPLVFNGGASGNNLTISLANTAGGNSNITATANSGNSSVFVNANNTLHFTFNSNTAGTYKVDAQTISVTGGGNPLYNPEEGNNSVSTANLEITGVVSNTFGTFTVE